MEQILIGQTLFVCCWVFYLFPMKWEFTFSGKSSPIVNAKTESAAKKRSLLNHGSDIAAFMTIISMAMILTVIMMMTKQRLFRELN